MSLIALETPPIVAWYTRIELLEFDIAIRLVNRVLGSNRHADFAQLTTSCGCTVGPTKPPATRLYGGSPLLEMT